MIFAAVETDIGEVLNLLRPDKTIGGKGLLSFINGLESLCQNGDDAKLTQWFAKLGPYVDGPICDLARPLIQAYYSGNWDYQEGHYQAFLIREQIHINEEEFTRAVKQVAEKWTEIPLLLKILDELNSALRSAKLESTWWYTFGYTDAELEALAQTLGLAVEREARKVRIRIT